MTRSSALGSLLLRALAGSGVALSLFVALADGASAQPASAQSAGEPVPNRILVKFRPDLAPPVEAELEDAGVIRMHRFLARDSDRFPHPLAQWAALTLAPGTDDRAAMDRIAAHPAVEAVHHDVRIEVLAIPDDPLFPLQWSLDNTGQTGGTPGADIAAPPAWDLETGDPAIVVAISDTGIDHGHPDLAANLWRNPGEIPGNGIDDDGNGIADDEFGANFVPLSAGQPATGDPLDDTLVFPASHGTLVAGIVGAAGNNGLGIGGVAWNVRLMAVKSFDATGSGTCATAMAGIEYAVVMGAQVINASWGWKAPGSGPFAGCEEPLRTAIDFANANGVLFVAGAGNNGDDNDTVPFAPAGFRLRNLIAVAATDSDDELAVFPSPPPFPPAGSNFGAHRVQIASPGRDVLSTMIRCDRFPEPGLLPCDYGLASGTSFAAPHVAGVAALLLSRHPTLTVDELKTAIVLGGDQLASLEGKVLQGRRLNAAGAVTAADSVVGSGSDLWVCDDGIDNDGDGLVDFPVDPECSAVFPDASEATPGTCGLGFELVFLLPLLLSVHAARVRRQRVPAGRCARDTHGHEASVEAKERA